MIKNVKNTRRSFRGIGVLQNRSNSRLINFCGSASNWPIINHLLNKKKSSGSDKDIIKEKPLL